jgi:Arc/MetJ family transcription regulator
MIITIELDDGLLRAAEESSGIAATDALVHEALKALIEREGARRLASMGGTMPGLRRIPRRQGRRR